MVRHNDRKHKKAAKKLEPLEVVANAKVFRCLKCKKPMLQDRSFIRSHLRRTHDENLTSKKLGGVNVSRSCNIKQKSSNPHLVKNECKFSCKFCPQVFESWKTTCIHHRDKHDFKGQLPKPTDMVIETTIHVCQLCGKELLKDNFIIQNHMRGAHRGAGDKAKRASQRKSSTSSSVKKSAIHDAEDPQIVEDACEFQCQDCTEVLNSWDAMTDHQISSHSSSERRAMSPEDFVIMKKLH